MKAVGLFFCLALLASVTTGVKIQCIYTVTSWHIGSLYSCVATVVSMEDPTKITEVSGNHWEGKSNEDVKAFEMYHDKTFTTVPKGYEKFFPNMDAFCWNYGKISSIDSSTFAAFPNFLSVNFDHNRLVSLDGDLFQATPKLRHIAFRNNKLEHVGHDLLTGLTDLEYVNFESNTCINAVASYRGQYQQLNLQLPIECPPLAVTSTATPTITAESCTEGKAKLEADLKAHSEELQALKLKNAELNTWKAQAEQQMANMKDSHKEIQTQLKETCDAQIELKVQENSNCSNDLQAKTAEINEKNEKIKQCEKKDQTLGNE